MIPPIDSLESQNKSVSGNATTSFILGYEEGSDGSLTYLKFDVTVGGAISISHAAWREDTKEIDVDIDNPTLSPKDENGELTVMLKDGARISDMELARDPKSGKHYLAVMVDLALEWPAQVDRSSMESMTVNQ